MRAQRVYDAASGQSRKSTDEMRETRFLSGLRSAPPVEVSLRDPDSFVLWNIPDPDVFRVAAWSGQAIVIPAIYGYDDIQALWEDGVTLYSIDGGPYLSPAEIPREQRLAVAQAFGFDPAHASEIVRPDCTGCFEYHLGNLQTQVQKDQQHLQALQLTIIGLVGFAGAKLDPSLRAPRMSPSRLDATNLSRANRSANLESRLIGANRAHIDPRKLTDYALNPVHPIGADKARVFESALGFNRSNVDALIAQIRVGVMEHPPVPGLVDKFGAGFTVDIPVVGPAGSGTVRTAWIYDPGSLTPRLVTLYMP